jgi:hypothetical protein
VIFINCDLGEMRGVRGRECGHLGGLLARHIMRQGSLDGAPKRCKLLTMMKMMGSSWVSSRVSAYPVDLYMVLLSAKMYV